MSILTIDLVEGFGVLFLTSLTGTLILAVWALLGILFENRGYFSLFYRLLCFLPLFFLIPVVGIFLYSPFTESFQIGIFSYLFWGTPTIHMVVQIFLRIWIVGVLLVLGAHLILAWSTEKRYRRERLSCDCTAQEIYREVCCRLGLTRPPAFYQSYVVEIPMQTGVIHPAVYLPVRSWEESALRIILLHELNHYRQRDVLVKWLSILVISVHWMNPAAWILQRKLVRWSEYSCDLLCMEQGCGAKEYFRVILDMAERRDTVPGIAGSALFEDRSELERRIRQVKKNRGKTGKGWISALLIAGTLTASTVSVCMATTVIAEVYYDIFQMTDEAVEDDAGKEVNSILELTEYTDNGPAKNIVQMEGEPEAIEASWVTALEWTVEENVMMTAPPVSVASGQSIIVFFTLDYETQDVKLGIIDSNNHRRYVYVTYYGTCSFSISESGEYRIFFENTGTPIDLICHYEVDE